MIRSRTLAAGLLAAGLLVYGPAAANAAPAMPSTTSVRPAAAGAALAAAADGYFYAWTETYRRGGRCRWAGNAETWGGCTNNVGSVENRGFAATLDDVNLYWGAYYSGAYACLGRGDMWLDLSIKREKFDHGVGLRGIGQALYNNVASSRWTAHC